LIANKNVDTIFVVKSSSADLKQYDQNPRYDSRDNVLLANRLFETNITFLDVSPTPNDLFHFTNIVKTDRPTQCKIIDLEAAKKSWDFPLLSNELIESSKKALDNNGKILFFYNKKGVANQLYCPECKYIAKCTDCNNDLHVLESTLTCKKCKVHYGYPTMCPKCENVILKTKGLGNKNIQKTLSQIFKNKIVSVVDKDNQPEDAEQADILLVTQYYIQNIYHPTNSPKFDLTAILSTSPGFIAPEPFQETDPMILIKTIEAITNKDSLLYVQTWEKDKINRIVHNSDKYLTDLQNQLKSHSLPPYSRLIRIHYKSTDLTEQQQKLDNVIRDINKDTSTIGPYLSHDRKRMILQLRISLLTNNEIFDKLKNLDDNYIVDSSPIHLT